MIRLSDAEYQGLIHAEKRAVRKVEELRRELAEARKDGERLDALERFIAENKDGGLLIHHQVSGRVKWSGSGLGLSHRSLRKAIDDCTADARGAK